MANKFFNIAIFQYLKSAFWGMFSSCPDVPSEVQMEILGEKTRNSLYMGWITFLDSRGKAKLGRTIKCDDFKKIEDFKRGFNRPMPGIEEQ